MGVGTTTRCRAQYRGGSGCPSLRAGRGLAVILQSTRYATADGDAQRDGGVSSRLSQSAQGAIGSIGWRGFVGPNRESPQCVGAKGTPSELYLKSLAPFSAIGALIGCCSLCDELPDFGR